MPVLRSELNGLYDETIERVSRDINNRHGVWKCRLFGHDWTNASLEIRWRTPGNTDRLPNCSADIGPAWNGAVRYCRRCKLVVCVHFFPDANRTTIKLDETPEGYVSYSIDTCKLCGLRILRGGSTVFTPSSEALAIVQAEVEKRPGKTYGSGFYCELPAQVSRVLRLRGEAFAKQYAKEVFEKGYVQCQ